MKTLVCKLLVASTLVLSVCMVSIPAAAQTFGCIKDFYAHKSFGIARPDAEKLIKDVGDAMAIVSEIVVVPCPYAVQVQSTVVLDDNTDGITAGEYVIYSPIWVQQVLGTSKVEAVAVFGHELGHFVQRHFSSRRSIPDMQKEAEADYFAGCAVASMKYPWQPLHDLLQRIRNETDEVYPNRLKSEEKAKQGYDTCSRASLPPQAADLKLQVIGDANTLRFLANGRLFASADIHDYQNGAGIGSNDIIYGRNSVTVRLGWAKDMLTIFQVKENEGKLCSNQLFVELRDGDGIAIATRKVTDDSTTYGVRYGRDHDLFNEIVAQPSDLKFFFDPREPRTGESRTPTTEIRGKLGEYSIVDHGCV
ncbi:M48 family metalloprotease [Rhizobium ruizarguesonis]